MRIIDLMAVIAILILVFGLIAGFGIGIYSQYHSDKNFLRNNVQNENKTGYIEFTGDFYRIEAFDPRPKLNLSNFANLTVIQKE